MVVFGCGIQKGWETWCFSLMALLIFIQSSSELVFDASFICTTPDTPYITKKWWWNFGYAALMVVSNSQYLVDNGWIFIYNDVYIKREQNRHLASTPQLQHK
jgi:hypothetical protein